MNKQFRIPFLFLVVGGSIGLLLRWHFLSPFSWLNYSFWLHGHSHIMFLGWILNFLLTAYLFNFLLWEKRRYRLLFWLNQVLLVGMLISFPMQGYGVVSICLSAAHTFCIWLFTVWFFKHASDGWSSPSIGCARISLLLFAWASIGPFLLGMLKANGLGHSPWYYNVVYYYLHFQYNGVFVFGVLSLWFNWMERQQLIVDSTQSRRLYVLLLSSLFPSYFLSTLWSQPPIVFNVIGFIGASLQLLAFYYFIKLIWVRDVQLKRYSGILIRIAIASFGLKCLLQLVSAHPAVAQLALESRPLLIAYLHLVLIGSISFSLLAWSIEMELVILRYSQPLLFVVTGFLGTELVMVFSGFIVSNIWPLLLFVFSLVLLAGLVIFALRVSIGGASIKGISDE